MTPSPLKFCRHRGLFVPPRGWRCTSPLVVAPGGIVSREMCDAQCPYVDHPPDPRFVPLNIGSNTVGPSVAPRTHKYPKPTIRNCIYHVCPLAANDLWRKNVRQLLRRAPLFNGKRLVAIATGDGMLPPEAVRREFGRTGFTFIEIPNDTWLREVASFPSLLQAVHGLDAQEATFYAHTKGNSTAQNVVGATYWRNAAYHYLLDQCDEAMELLQEFPCVGTHKITWPHGESPYPSRLRVGNWMFAGTFFWFRNDLVFSHPAWSDVAADRYGAEAWLSSLFTVDEAFSTYQLWPETMYPSFNPYDPLIYERPYDDDEEDVALAESVLLPPVVAGDDANRFDPVPRSDLPGDIRFSTEIRHRGDLPLLCNALGLTDTACEVGIHLAHYAFHFLSLWRGKRFLAVDNYLPHSDVPGDRQQHKREAHQRLAPFAERVTWLEQDSRAAMNTLKPASLDLCYIDAAHDYDAVSREIDQAWHLVRSQGILAGHDYDPTHPGVVQAVREFSQREKVCVQITQDVDGPWSWYCFKP